jgi:flagellar assembly factor FliW
MDNENSQIPPVETEILDKYIEFPLGVPGFQQCRRFIFARQPEEHPFAWMRSLDDERLAFAVVEAYHLIPDFSFEVDDSELEIIGSPSPEHCAVFFIVRIEADKKVKILVNSDAPLIINTKDRKGRQIVLPVSERSAKQPMVFEF